MINLFLHKKYNSNVELLENIEAKDLDIKDIENKPDLSDLLQELISEFILKNPTFINAVERGIEDKEKLSKEINSFLNRRALGLSDEERSTLIDNFDTYVWGYGPLQKLIDSKTITDIKTIDYDDVRITEFGIRSTSDVVFNSREALKQYVNYVAVKNKIPLSEINAIQRTTDKTSSDNFILRIDICSESLTSTGVSYLHIRKISKFKDSLDDLMKKDMFNCEIKDYLIKAMESDLGIVICGKGSDGKTTLLNSLIEKIPYDRAGLIVQETEELFSNKHPDLMQEKIMEPKGESIISYSLSREVKNGLVSDVDYMIIGEIKGEEAWDLVNAAYTGYAILTTVHARSSMEAPNKLVHYMKTSPNAKDMSKGDLLETLTGIDVIIFMKGFKCFEITEVEGFDPVTNSLIFNKVFEYKIKASEDGKIVGNFMRINDSCSNVKEKILYREFKRNDLLKKRMC